MRVACKARLSCSKGPCSSAKQHSMARGVLKPVSHGFQRRIVFIGVLAQHSVFSLVYSAQLDAGNQYDSVQLCNDAEQRYIGGSKASY